MNAYLVDSHTLLWAVGDPGQLSPTVSRVLADSDHRIFVSVATLWELSIKQNVGKLTVPDGFFDSLFQVGYERLAILDEHLAAYRQLPLHHRDPFDRLLVAQAQVEDLALLSRDAYLKQYDVEVIW